VALTQAELEKRYSPQTVVQFCDDDGDLVADAAIVAMVLEDAEEAALGLLLMGGPRAWADATLAGNKAARNAAYQIAAGIMGERRAEFMVNGRGVYASTKADGERKLAAIAAAEQGNTAAATAGPNTHEAYKSAPREAARVFLTTRTTDYKAPGGF
jgi:hypothetical protein